MGVLNTKEWEKMQFLTEIAVLVGNATRHASSYNGSLIGSHGSDCFNDLELPRKAEHEGSFLG